jgi:hypothetical protein
MTSNQFEILSIGLVLLLVLAVIAALAAGVVCLVRFAKTRKKIFLIAGLLLTLLLPGCLLLLGILAWLPNAFVAYGPPPSNYVP